MHLTHMYGERSSLDWLRHHTGTSVVHPSGKSLPSWHIGAQYHVHLRMRSSAVGWMSGRGPLYRWLTSASITPEGYTPQSMNLGAVMQVWAYDV